METFFGAITSYGNSNSRTGNTFSDRLNSKYTTSILCLFAVLVTTKNYMFGDPISCWCPAHFTEPHCKYANNVCWVTSTYHLPFHIDLHDQMHPKKHIGYYQWVGLILIGQAMLFYIPRIIWRVMYKKSGISVSTVTDAAVECQRSKSSEERKTAIEYVTKHLSRYLNMVTKMHNLASKRKIIWWYIYGNYIQGLYLAVKALYLLNVIGQFYLLNVFLETDYHMYGFFVVKKLLDGDDWRTSDRFPRVTLCDFELRILGNVNKYTVQCALPVNMFNEMIYIFLWFWFAAVAMVTSLSLITWGCRVASCYHQRRFIYSRLVAMGRFSDTASSHNDEIVKKFVRNYLRRDGVFLIRLIARNASDLIAAEVISGLYTEFEKNLDKPKNKHSIEDIEESNSSNVALLNT